MADKDFDVVCGMNLRGAEGTASARYDREVFRFCGEFCKGRFEKNPEKFLGEPLIKLSDVWKVFNLGDETTEVLRGVNLNIWKGDFVSIIGASGSGKSTTLNMIGILDRPTSGRVLLRGRDVELLDDAEQALLRSRTFGFVFQQYNLIPWLTAYENATLPLIFSGRDVNNESSVKQKFQQIGIGSRLAHHPFELSGGEQQRVALLRALANDPEVILGDEPTGNLDSTTGQKILEMLIGLNKKEGKTLIVVTHDAEIAEQADQVIIIKDGQTVHDHQIHERVYTWHHRDHRHV